jgi:hypothetical protein
MFGEESRFGGDNRLVKQVDAFASVARKLAERNGTVCFWNTTKEFKFLLRNIPLTSEEGAPLDIELQCIVIADDEEGSDDEESHVLRPKPSTIGKVLELEYDGYWDENDSECYVMDTLRIKADEPETLDRAVKVVNELYMTRLCPCDQYLCRSEDQMCLACELSADTRDLDTSTCPICHDTAFQFHCRKLACCRQSVHAKCLAKWAKEKALCPLCRASL